MNKDIQIAKKTVQTQILALKKLSAKKKITTVGIGFSFQKCSKIPVNKNDHVLDCVLNEKKMIFKDFNPEQYILTY